MSPLNRREFLAGVGRSALGSFGAMSFLQGNQARAEGSGAQKPNFVFT